MGSCATHISHIEIDENYAQFPIISGTLYLHGNQNIPIDEEGDRFFGFLNKIGAYSYMEYGARRYHISQFSCTKRNETGLIKCCFQTGEPFSGKIVARMDTVIKKNLESSNTPLIECHLPRGAGLLYKNAKRYNENFLSVEMKSISGYCSSTDFKLGSCIYIYHPDFSFSTF